MERMGGRDAAKIVASGPQERFLRFSEVLYREGEKQNQDWRGP